MSSLSRSIQKKNSQTNITKEIMLICSQKTLYTLVVCVHEKSHAFKCAASSVIHIHTHSAAKAKRSERRYE